RIGMNNNEMSICQCCEFLDAMYGDDESTKECIDYIERKAQAMCKKLKKHKKKIRILKKKNKYAQAYIKELKERL
ncbi:MAG: hypothetical protein Q4A76_09000, partial [Porphyromonadaceae bacterium]|nr:hypothetical protein [Porphyromonadaceae bacterium]